MRELIEQSIRQLEERREINRVFLTVAEKQSFFKQDGEANSDGSLLTDTLRLNSSLRNE